MILPSKQLKYRPNLHRKKWLTMHGAEAQAIELLGNSSITTPLTPKPIYLINDSLVVLPGYAPGFLPACLATQTPGLVIQVRRLSNLKSLSFLSGQSLPISLPAVGESGND